MSKTVLADVDGFTPVIDELAEKYGLVRAAVFGRIWRYCQMEDGVCHASLETISKALGIDRATVMRHAQSLADDGYLEDTTPDRRNAPHVYKDTGKAGIRINITVAHNNSLPKTVAESHTTVAQRNATVAESQLKRVLKKESKKDKESGTPKPRDPLLDNPAVVAFKEITHRTPNEIQRIDISKSVNGNLDEWRRSVEHWCGHGWNKTNVTGMLSFLSSGGVGACSQCKRNTPARFGSPSQGATLESLGITNR